MDCRNMASSSSPKSTPKDAQVMQAILKDLGVTDYEPRVINQMMEFTYRYVTDVLDDAKVYSTHANKKNIDVDDVKLAIQCRLDHEFTTPPPKDLLMDIAKHKNSTPMPLIKPYTGPKLPPDRYCLSSANYRLKSLKKPRTQLSSGGSIASLVTGPRLMSQIGGKSGISVSAITGGGSLALVTRGMTTPTVTLVRPQTTAPATPVSTAPRPFIQRVPSATTMTTNLPTSVQQQNTTMTIPGTSLQQPDSLKRKHEDDDYDKP